MQESRVKSFTLAEMLVVMIITAIVVGIAFSVLNLVRKQVEGIKKNFDKTTELAFFEQRLWQDFNTHNNIIYIGGKIIMLSDNDTVNYNFKEHFIVRQSDTIHADLTIEKAFYIGNETKSGSIDAIKISVNAELPDYTIFVSSVNDATYNMNQDGF